MTPAAIDDFFTSGRQAHQAGRLAEAEAFYRRVLAAKPDHTDALHALGLLAQQTNHVELARELIGKAVQLHPASDEYQASYKAVLTAHAQPAATPKPPLNAANFPGSNSPVITNPKRDDGFGAQFQTLIYSVIYAELTNKKFVYTPFKAMAHNYDNDPQFLARKETLVNFISNFGLSQDVEQTIIREDFIRFFEHNLELCAASESLKKIKRIFRMNKPITKPPGVTVAMHVRRPNSHDNRADGTDTPDAFYLNIITYLKDLVYKDKSLNIHIYSQGTEDGFAAFKSVDNITLHLNSSVEDTFTGMVLADVLVASRSSLSYAAALISDGDIFYLPFWHPPLKHWKVIVG